jgi:hypothetical protein
MHYLYDPMSMPFPMWGALFMLVLAIMAWALVLRGHRKDTTPTMDPRIADQWAQDTITHSRRTQVERPVHLVSTPTTMGEARPYNHAHEGMGGDPYRMYVGDPITRKPL